MENKHKIINHLAKHIERGFTMHELSKVLGIPYASFHRTIQRMKDLLMIEKVGKARVVHLNLKSHTVKAHLIIASEEEKKGFLEQQPTIKKIANELDTKNTVVLFGSYAKRKETERSDIDLLIMSKDGKKDISFSKYELLFKKKINPLFITKNEFKKMLKEKEENVGKQALKNNIILNNPEEFWGCVLDAV